MMEHHIYDLIDQAAMNLIFYRNYEVLPDKWNFCGLGEPMMQDGITRERLQGKYIWHWSGPLKPWKNASVQALYDSLA